MKQKPENHIKVKVATLVNINFKHQLTRLILVDHKIMFIPNV